MVLQPLMVQSVPESPFPQPLAHNLLRLRVLRPNRRHVIVPLLWRKFIHLISVLHRSHGAVQLVDILQTEVFQTYVVDAVFVKPRHNIVTQYDNLAV